MKTDQLCRAYPSWCQRRGLGQRSKARGYNQDIKALRQPQPLNSQLWEEHFERCCSSEKHHQGEEEIETVAKVDKLKKFILKSAEHCSVQAMVM